MSLTPVHIGIKRNRLKLVGFFYGFGALVLFMGCYFMAQGLEAGWALALKITGGVIAILLAVTGASAVSLLNKKDAGLLLDQKGITDQSTSISAGLVEWKSIDEVELVEAKKMILIRVKFPENFIKNAKNRAVKQLYQRNFEIYKTPVIIESTYLDSSFEDLGRHIVHFQKAYWLKPAKQKRH